MVSHGTTTWPKGHQASCGARSISGTLFKRGAVHYLELLGIAQTCRFQGKSFLQFLLSEEIDVDSFQSAKRIKISKAVSRQPSS
jgi:hypothetical protein